MRERVCKNCGGRQYVVVGQNMVKCQFCGTLYVDEQASKEEATLTVWAFEKLFDLKFEQALDEFDKILSRYPMSFEAFFGKALAKNKIVLYSSKGTARKKPRFFGDTIVSITEDEDFKKAVELAPPDVAKTYELTAKRIDKIIKECEKNEKNNPCDVFFCALDFDKENPNQRILSTLDGLKNKNLSTYFVQGIEGKEREEESFDALKKAKVFVLYANKTSGFNEPEIKNFCDRYKYFIMQKQKTSASFIIALDGQATASCIPKELLFTKSVVDISKEPVTDELISRAKSEFEIAKDELLKIEKVEVGHVSSVKKENVNIESVTSTELGNYHVENTELSEANKIKWVFVCLKNGDFETAREVLDKELSVDPNNSELLFASLLCEYKIHTAGEFFSDIANFKDKEKINKILKYASKDFAEMIVDNWEELIIKHNSVEYYNAFLLYLAQFNSPKREQFISCAESKAIESLDQGLIEKVLKCFKSNEVDRFENFYFLLAQNSGDDRYYKKVLEIDAGHEQSNIALFLHNFKTDADKLAYRDKQEFENVLQYLAQDKRVRLISSIVDMVLSVSYQDLSSAEHQLDFYLSYIEDDKTLALQLKIVAAFFQGLRFFTAAEKYISIAISKNKEDAELYWILIQIKCHCDSQAKLIKTDIRVTKMPEWESLLAYADQSQTEKYGEIISKSNSFAGQKSPITEEWFDQKVLKEKLNDFLLRNEKILLECDKQDGAQVLRGTNYYRLQLEPFENYVKLLQQDLTFEEYRALAKKIAMRLSLLDLTLDMSINITAVYSKEDDLKNIKSQTLNSNLSKKRKKENVTLADEALKKEHHKIFIRRYLYCFLELFPTLFTTLLLVVILAIPKEVYMYFNQNFVLALVCLSAATGIVNLTIYLVRKKKMHKNWKIANAFLMIFAFMNIALMCLGFYIVPDTISIDNASEFNTLVHNACYAELKLETDIDLSGTTWKPSQFFGTLDGNGHRVQNLSTGSGKDVAIFTKNTGVVKNLKVTYAVASLQNISNFGGIAVTNTGKIQNCEVFTNGTIIISAIDDFNFGGIATNLKGGSVSDCTVTLYLSVSVSNGQTNIGGIVGQVLSKSGAEIVGCSSTITLNMTGTNAPTANVGGLAGKVSNISSDKVDISKNHASVSMTIGGSANRLMVGGLIGIGESGSENNYSNGSISVSIAANECNVGGLYGKYENSSPSASINHSYSAVEFSCDGMTVGGLVGALGGTIKNSFTSQQVVVCGKTLSSLASYDSVVESGVTEYNSKFGFDANVWNLPSSALPTLK